MLEPVSRPGLAARLPAWLTAAACSAAALGAWAQTPLATAYAFRGVQVVGMDEQGVLAEQTVIVEGNRISAIGPADYTPVPGHATVIEGAGRYLSPGLAEMHAHVPGPGDAQYLEDVLFLYVANGVTTVRGMLGQPSHLALREALRRHEVIGPRLITSGPSLSGDSVTSPAEAAGMVERQARAGYDFIKLHPGLTRAEFDAAVRAGRANGIALAGHVSVEVGVGRALEAGQATIDHLDGYIQYLIPDRTAASDQPAGFFGLAIADRVDEALIPVAAQATREAGVWVVPTQILIEHWALPEPSAEALAARSEMAYMPRDMVERWQRAKERLVGSDAYSAERARRLAEIRRRLIKALHDRGAGLLLGSDAPQVFNVPGFSLHDELDAIVAAGLSPYEALRTGTANPARFFGAENEFGRVREGMAADLLLIGENPLEDLRALRALEGVMVRGVWLDRGRLDAGLAAIARRRGE